jgi:DNA-binding MarR family transcriptional regulator
MNNSKQAIKYSPTPLHYLMYILQQKSDDLLQGEVGVSLSHVRILGALDYKVPCSQKSIASQLQQTEANVSRQLLTMNRQGLVKVLKNKDDSRARDVTVTAKGKRRYEAAESALKRQLNSVYKGLSKQEKRDFEDSINKITSSL